MSIFSRKLKKTPKIQQKMSQNQNIELIFHKFCINKTTVLQENIFVTQKKAIEAHGKSHII